MTLGRAKGESARDRETAWRALGARLDEAEHALDAGDLETAGDCLSQSGAIVRNARLRRDDERVRRMLALKRRRDAQLFDSLADSTTSSAPTATLFDVAAFTELTHEQLDTLRDAASESDAVAVYATASLSGRSATLRLRELDIMGRTLRTAWLADFAVGDEHTVETLRAVQRCAERELARLGKLAPSESSS